MCRLVGLNQVLDLVLPLRFCDVYFGVLDLGLRCGCGVVVGKRLQG